MNDMSCISGGGEMGALMRSFDWSRTSLGPTAGWSPCLRNWIGLCLNSRFPLSAWWGPDFNFLYNDACRPYLGDKHPAALGAPGREIWPEAWDSVGPILQSIRDGGPPTWATDMFTLLNRRGRPVECYFTKSYSPILDEAGRIVGVFAPATETTARVIDERRLRTLGHLARLTAGIRTAEEVCRIAGQVLAGDPNDLPFALIYLVVEDGSTAQLAGIAGLPGGLELTPERVILRAESDVSNARGWPLAHAAMTRQNQFVDDLSARFGALPDGSWPVTPKSAILVPSADTGQHCPTVLLVAGLSPWLSHDDGYHNFIDLMAGQVSGAVRSARALEYAKRRSDELAEINRAKTVFFSNISHELRTPLTLALGPLETILQNSEAGSRAFVRSQVAMAHRNCLRLLNLVNTLLDFSRLEAGHLEGTFEPVALDTVTAELANMFRTVVEAASLRFNVVCQPLPDSIYVDLDMWEKIVLNLLSNAFKFTLKGEIEVRLAALDDKVELTVRDTGIGIPKSELDHIFERFHQIDGSSGRTREGSGIGLSLVQELVRLHGGTVGVASREGFGSTFTVQIPIGCAHLPAERIRTGSASRRRNEVKVQSYVEAAGAMPAEAMRGDVTGVMDRPRILVAEDNSDMREYIRGLLEPRYSVISSADGEAALASIKMSRPDLVLADVMMPRLDGLGLIKAIRKDSALSDLLVIMISARAGEEARLGGLEAGADDYLIKPFSARELLARLEANLKLVRLRREAAEREMAALRELAGMRESLHRVQKMEALGKLTGGVAHDFNNLLTSVIGNLDMIVQRPDRTDRVERLARSALAAAERGEQVVRQLLMFARREPLQPLPIEVNRKLLEISHLLRHSIGEVHQLKLRFDAEIDVCCVDFSQFENAILNLVLNARDSMPDGGEIDIETSNIQASPEPGTKSSEVGGGEYVKIVVKDKGCGMSPEVLERAFEPFFSTKDMGVGSGLGLSQVYGFVKQSGGEVLIESNPGIGTSVSLHLPRSAPIQREPPAPKVVRGNTCATVLLVDDDARVLNTNQESLQDFGCRVLTARNGTEALDILHSVDGIDLLFSDIVMPGGPNGFQLAREAKRLQPSIKVLLTSGYAPSELSPGGSMLGNIPLLRKPYHREKLRQTLANVLGGGATLQ